LSSFVDANKSLIMEVLIVGQGIAGTLMAHQFLKRGVKAMVVDEQAASSSSLVAAGIINPITGRNFNKTWEFGRLWNYLVPFYQELEKLLETKLFHSCSIHRALPNAKEFNDWSMRSQDPDIHYLVNNAPNLDQFKHKIKLPEFCSAFPGARVDTAKMVTLYREYLKRHGLFLDQCFQYSDLSIEKDCLVYQGIQFKFIVFAEGHKASLNPYFKALPFRPFKGQILELTMFSHGFTDILKNQLFFVPLNEDKVWVGTENTHHPINDNVEDSITQKLMDQCAHLLETQDWEPKESRAAIRPAISDRRPILGAHPLWKNIFIFNGLGSKGTSLGPYFSEVLYQHMLIGAPLPAEVDIQRFYPLFQ
jgi:glycine oxidase